MTKLCSSSSDGWTPLDSASQTRHDAIVQFLVERGADVPVQNNDGMPVARLHSVPGNGHSQVVRPNLRHPEAQTKLGGLRGIWRRTTGMWKSRFSSSSRESHDSSSRVSQM